MTFGTLIHTSYYSAKMIGRNGVTYERPRHQVYWETGGGDRDITIKLYELVAIIFMTTGVFYFHNVHSPKLTVKPTVKT